MKHALSAVLGGQNVKPRCSSRMPHPSRTRRKTTPAPQHQPAARLPRPSRPSYAALPAARRVPVAIAPLVLWPGEAFCGEPCTPACVRIFSLLRLSERARMLPNSVHAAWEHRLSIVGRCSRNSPWIANEQDNDPVEQLGLSRPSSRRQGLYGQRANHHCGLSVCDTASDSAVCGRSRPGFGDCRHGSDCDCLPGRTRT